MQFGWLRSMELMRLLAGQAHFYSHDNAFFLPSDWVKERERLTQKLFRPRTWAQCLKITQNVAFKRFSILPFSTNFCLIKIDLSGNTFWPQAPAFKELAKQNWLFFAFEWTFVLSKCKLYLEWNFYVKKKIFLRR